MAVLELLHGDCRTVMAGLPAASVDAVVCDPPYGLSFMGKDWDHGVPGVAFWSAALRVAKPGAYLLAFGGTRTFHRLAVAIEDAGWEIRDTVMWVYGSGFPKSHDVGKAIDKAAGAERAAVTTRKAADLFEAERDIVLSETRYNEPSGIVSAGRDERKLIERIFTAPATAAAQQWEGWGTALKPAWEPIIVARKPLEGTVAANVLAHGTGALNIDGCRVGTDGGTAKGSFPNEPSKSAYGDGLNGACDILDIGKGRWPANLIHDGSAEVLAAFPDVHGAGAFKEGAKQFDGEGSMFGIGQGKFSPRIGDSGSAARFFYCAKADKTDREDGLRGSEVRPLAYGNQAQAEVKRGNTSHSGDSGMNTVKMRGNHHPTVKPTDLMRYLCRLVTPKGGTVLDPFMGSGSTLKAAELEGFSAIGIEIDAEYCEIARNRIASDIPLFA